MGNCLTKFGCGRKDLAPEQKHKLEELFQHIVTNAAVDFDNQELKDIQAALNIMLERIMIQVNRQGIFKIARIVPGGSMVEKTSLWKFYNKGQNYLEFDFLAVLENEIKLYEGKAERNTCKTRGCIKTVTSVLDFDRMRDYYEVDYELNAETVNHKRIINNCFIRTINHCLTSSCDCLRLSTDKVLKEILIRPTAVERKHGCDLCTVEMPTGTLYVHTETAVETSVGSGNPNRCSLIFLWSSKALSLSAPDRLLQTRRSVSSVPIFVGCLPAMESMKTCETGNEDEHDFFIVPKDCNVCDYVYHVDEQWNDYTPNKWRKSWCVAEMKAFTQMSERHRKCYEVMKYLSVGDTELPNYHIKTVLLNHHTTCSDTTENFVDCIIRICWDLIHAYETRKLMSFYSNLNILKGVSFQETHDLKKSCKRLIDILCSVPASESWDTFAKTRRPWVN